jgi:hypothetical protein
MRFIGTLLLVSVLYFGLQTPRYNLPQEGREILQQATSALQYSFARLESLLTR